MKDKTNKVKIAYYCLNDPLDKRSWSGITYYLGQTLQKNIGEVDFLGPVKFPWLLDKTLRGMAKFSRIVFRSEYIPKYSFLKNVYASLYLRKKMKGKEYDFIMAPAAASELAFAPTHFPIIYFGDATYKVYSESYGKEFKNLNSFSRWEGNQLEKRALKRSALVILSSNWAAKSAIQDYKVSPNKIKVMQMGANIDKVPDRSIIFNKLQNKTLTLLFLGVDWERKGGPIAFETLEQLHANGIKAKLIVCGCVPPDSFSHPYMEVIPFLNKNDEKDYQRFVELLINSHFLLLPTRADCTPLVNCEVNAYGMPAITTNVGGISDTVIDGVNGYCLPFEATGRDYATLLKNIFQDEEGYHQFICSSRQRFEDELNWDKWAEQFQQIIQKDISLV